MTVSNEEKIFIGIDKERIELKGTDKDNFIAQREADKTALELVKAENDVREARKASAKQKLQDLGLTVDEIKEAFGI